MHYRVRSSASGSQCLSLFFAWRCSMSTKMPIALTGLATSLICTIIIIAIALAHLQAIEAAWFAIQYWIYGGAGLALLFFAYRLGSKLYHIERTRYLER